MTFARLFRLGASMAADSDYIAGARQLKASHKISDFGVKVLGQNPPLRSRTLAISSTFGLKVLAS